MATVTAEDLATHLQHAVSRASSEQAINLATRYAHSYTRGRGFDQVTGEPGGDIAAVILTAAVRFLLTPSSCGPSRSATTPTPQPRADSRAGRSPSRRSSTDTEDELPKTLGGASQVRPCARVVAGPVSESAGRLARA